MKKLAVILGVLALCASAFAQFSNIQQRNYYASDFAYGWNAESPGLGVGAGSNSAGTYAITLNYGFTTSVTGIQFYPVNVNAPIAIGSGTAYEVVTPTSVSCSTPMVYQTCTITAAFTYAHGVGDTVRSGSAGLQEAINFLQQWGGGKVIVDLLWSSLGGTNALLSAAVPYQNVFIEDTRAQLQYWNPNPSTTSLLAAPAVLTGQAACDTTHQFCSDSTVAGSASWGGTVYGCYTLVDINGNESPCSATNYFTTVASKAIDMGVSFTARTDNVVGWKPYLSVSAGSYVLAYSVPLLTQPTVLLATPVSSGVCTLTTLETTTPACAIANSKYGQSGSTVGAGTLFTGGAQYTGYPVVSNTLAPEIGSVSALQHNPNEEAHATYAYIPSQHVGLPGVQSEHIIFPITAAAQTGIAEVEGSFPLPANFMNYVGRTIEVCGLIVKTSTTADVTDTLAIWWDAEGSNVTAGTPVKISSINLTPAVALAAAANFQFCQQLTTTVASTSATGGTITPGVGFLTVSQVSAGANSAVAATSLVAGIASLNLALPAHLTVELLHNTGTDGAGTTLEGATVRVIN